VERTLVLIKPDAVSRGLVGEIISRFERKKLKLLGLKMLRADGELVAQHYAEHVDKPFYAELAIFTMSGPIVAMVLAGHQAVHVVRTLMGPTDGVGAPLGTIRGDFASGDPIRENLVHGSDSAESAARELELFFGGDFDVDDHRVSADGP